MADPVKTAPVTEVQFKGSCACSRLTYECRSLPAEGQTTACHCVICRKLSGGPYQAYTDVESQTVTFFDNTEHLRYEGLPKDNIGGIVFLRFSPAGERAFCVSCYSPLAIRYKHMSETVGITLGSVDESSVANAKAKEALALKGHIFTSPKAWWADIETDGLPRHERFSGGFEESVMAWQGKDDLKD